MAGESTSWFEGKRSEALAISFLTRRPDLHVTTQFADDRGIDLLVELTDHGRATGRYFAVQVRGYQRDVQFRRLRAEDLLRGAEDLPFPLGAMAFDVKTDRGQFYWLKEPLSHNGPRELRTAKLLTWRELNDRLLEDIVRGVAHWYERTPQAKAG